MIETREMKVMQSRANLYHVPVKQWRKWPPKCRQVFNDVYSQMTAHQDFFKHPKAVQVPKSQWSTVCWNAAWTAATASQETIA